MRPACPSGHEGKVYLDGAYGQAGTYRRQGYRCVPTEGRRHRFPGVLGKRQLALAEAAGAICQGCERPLTGNEGSETARRYDYSVREVARALVAVAQGRSLREAGRELRTGYAHGNERRRVTAHGQLVSDYIEAYADVITSHFLPKAWPRSLALDEKTYLGPLYERSGQRKSGGYQHFLILAAYGYDEDLASGKPVRLMVRGGFDEVEWASALAELPGEVSWVVTDEGRSAPVAATKRWPAIQTWVCEGHLMRTGAEKLAVDGIYYKAPLHRLWRKAFRSRADWEEFEAALSRRRQPAVETRKWVAAKRALVLAQFEARQQGRPRGVGALETVIADISERIGTRGLVFRNRPRLQRLLDLMTVELRGEADETAWAGLIRAHLVANGGRPAVSRRSSRDIGSQTVRDRASLAKMGRAVARRRQKPRHKGKVATRVQNKRLQVALMAAKGFMPVGEPPPPAQWGGRRTPRPEH